MRRPTTVSKEALLVLSPAVTSPAEDAALKAPIPFT